MDDYTFTAHLATGQTITFELYIERGDDGTLGLLDAARSFITNEVRAGAAEVYDIDHRAWMLTPDAVVVAVSLESR